MTIKVSKPAINIREELADLKQDTGLKGQELMRADTAQEVRTAIGAGRKNLIINGGMNVAQRATSATTLVHSTYHTVDRWTQNFTGPAAFTSEQSTDAPVGFNSSYKIACTTAEASLAATSRLMPYYRVEDKGLGYLKFGTSSAEDLTMSFWVKSNKTGTYQINLWHLNVSGYISATYSINSSATWEKKIITFKGDIGTAMGDDKDMALQLEFILTGGSNYKGGTFIPNTTGTYPGYAANTRAVKQTVNLADSTSNYWQITGVQLEVGSVATEFEHRSYGEELALCMRYYYAMSAAQGAYYSSYLTRWITEYSTYPVEMRANPTVSYKSGSIRYAYYQYNYMSDNLSALSTKYGDEKGVSLIIVATGSYSPTNHGMFTAVSNSYRVNIDAEL